MVGGYEWSVTGGYSRAGRCRHAAFKKARWRPHARMGRLRLTVSYCALDMTARRILLMRVE
jgi:hypothetical protein